MKPRHDINVMENVDGQTTADELLDMIESARPAWHAHAACRGKPAVMFPRSVQSHAAAIRHAVDICNTCPVFGACREQGKDEPYGVWAGELKDRRKARSSNMLDLLKRTGRWWTVPQLAEHIGVTERSVLRQLSNLRNHDLIETQIQPDLRPTLHRALPKDIK